VEVLGVCSIYAITFINEKTTKRVFILLYGSPRLTQHYLHVTAELGFAGLALPETLELTPSFIGPGRE